MNLQQIETIVLANVGADRYSDLASSTDDAKIADFSILHYCVLLARNEIKLYTEIPAILKRSSSNKTVASQKAYNLPSDFDVPVRVRYRTSTNEWELKQVYPHNLLQQVGGLTTTEGTPSLYMIFGSSSNRIQLELYNIPENSNEDFDIEYKPILSLITATSEYDAIMSKYPHTVIKLASAFAIAFLRKDMTQFDNWYVKGFADFSLINQREISADSSYKELPDALTRARRMARATK